MNCKIKSAIFLGLVAALFNGCTTVPSPEIVPVFSTLGISPVIIEPQEIYEISADFSKTYFKDLLQEIGTAQILNSLYRQRIAQAVKRLSNDSDKSQLIKVETTISLPLSLPREIYGINASQRKGALASIVITFKEKERVLVKVQESLNWNEVRWSSGGNKMRRRRRTDDVLLDAIEELTKKGIFKIQAQLASQGLDNQK